MKKYRAIVILLIVLVISVVGCMAVVADINDIDISAAKNGKRLFAARTKTLVLPGYNDNLEDKDFFTREIVDGKATASGGKSISPNGTELKYSHSEARNGKYSYDVYYDVNPDKNENWKLNEYKYDLSGNLILFNIYPLVRDVNIQNASDLLTEQQALELAQKYVYLLFGDEMGDYVTEWSSAHLDQHYYSFGFAKKYGYAVGERCFIDICTNGLLFAAQRTDYNKYKDFDTDMLSNIPEQQLLDDIDEYVKYLYSDNLVDYDVDSVNLKKNGDKYYLLALVNIHYDNNGDVLYDGQEYYYELG